MNKEMNNKKLYTQIYSSFTYHENSLNLYVRNIEANGLINIFYLFYFYTLQAFFSTLIYALELLP